MYPSVYYIEQFIFILTPPKYTNNYLFLNYVLKTKSVCMFLCASQSAAALTNIYELFFLPPLLGDFDGLGAEVLS